MILHNTTLEVNAIAPGMIDTDITGSGDSNKEESKGFIRDS